jgi:pimeloyl-ACP methyl ester carboxylesterase
MGTASSRVDQTMRLPNGRILGYAEYGCEKGYPLMFMHGYPSCRLEASAVDHIVRRRGIRMIAPERPGFGLSTVQPNRRIMDWPCDVQALARHLRLSRFAVMGGSGGGPYALACALGLPQDMVSAVGVFAGAGNWEAGAHHMPWIYRASMLAAEHWPAGLRGSLTAMMWMLRNGLNTQMATRRIDYYLQNDQDQHSKSIETRRAELVRILFEPFAQGAGPAVYEARLLSQAWDIEFGDITYNNLHIWHAEKDWNSPLPMTEFYVRQLSNNPSFKVYERDTHFTIHRHLDGVLSELIPESMVTEAQMGATTVH